MIKSAIKHSAIRSAIRKPFVPNDDGYREYLKRSVFELNGTQWGELSEPVVISTSEDFEFEVVVQMTKPVGFFFFEDSSSADDNERLNINGLGELVCKFSGVFRNFGTIPDPVTNKVSTYVIKRVGDILTYSVDGVTHISATVPTSLIIQKLFRSLEGSLFNQRIWTNGDRNTGDLILNVPFDESGSDYQRNRAVALGSELVTDVDFSEGLGTWTPGATSELEIGNNSIIVRSTAGGVSARYAQYILTGLEIGKNYLASVRVKNTGGTNNDLIVIKLNIRNSDSSGHRQAATGADSIGELLELVFTANSETMKLWLRFDGSKSDNTTFVEFSDPSIREWSGVILQNALPEDWMQTEKKRWWDYWLGPELVTPDAWLAPVFRAPEWGLIDGSWVCMDDGSSDNGALTFIPTPNQPDTMLVSGVLPELDGVMTTGQYSSDTTNVAKAGLFRRTVRKDIDIRSTFKRAYSDPFSVTLSSVSIRRKLEIAQ